MQEQPDRRVCIVDFQQQSQLNAHIPMKNIVGIIDHHAFQSSTVVTDKPVYVDIRPWGSMSTIIAHTFAINGRFLPRNIAGILLSAILSDTLNLKSPTTTEWDKRLVSMLVHYIGMNESVNEFAAKQFRAKSRALALMSPYALVNGDMKHFKFQSTINESVVYHVGYSVIETTDAEASLERADEIISEMREVREEGDLTCQLLAVVDIVNLTSTLLICGPVEASLAEAAYGGELVNNGTTLELKGLVSRKNDFIPPLSEAVKNGWEPPKLPAKPQPRRTSVIVMDYTGNASGRLLRVFDSS
jgi:inorganic pyrophosphatase/exopolyphosphatase